ECVTCHMPRLTPTDIAHTASTDHRILRRPAPPDTVANAGYEGLKVWREPPAPFRARDLALATLIASVRFPALRDEGIELLEELPRATVANDAPVLYALAGAEGLENRPEAALALARAAAAKNPTSAAAAYRLSLGLRRARDTAGAERELRRAVDLDPSLREAWMDLVMLYDRQGRADEKMATMNRFLAWNPQDMVFRLEKARISGGK